MPSATGGTDTAAAVPDDHVQAQFDAEQPGTAPLDRDHGDLGPWQGTGAEQIRIPAGPTWTPIRRICQEPTSHSAASPAARMAIPAGRRSNVRTAIAPKNARLPNSQAITRRRPGPGVYGRAE